MGQFATSSRFVTWGHQVEDEADSWHSEDARDSEGITEKWSQNPDRINPETINPKLSINMNK